MEIGIIGLGRMGMKLALNMLDRGHRVAGYDPLAEQVRKAEEYGVKGAFSLKELVGLLLPRRAIWLMVPAGEPVEETIGYLTALLTAGDVIIDGGNSNYEDTLRRYNRLKTAKIDFLDIGTSGGTEGARDGICAMVGGEPEVFAFLEPLLRDICVPNGYIHTGAAGSGHFVKMIHNGIEYGMLQAMGEGFEILANSQFDLDLAQVARVWNHGSVIRGWLMDLMHRAFAKDPRLTAIKDVVHSSGEGLWTAMTALQMGVPAPVIIQSVLMRFRSVQEENFAGKVVAALRQEFGGHEVVRNEEVK